MHLRGLMQTMHNILFIVCSLSNTQISSETLHKTQLCHFYTHHNALKTVNIQRRITLPDRTTGESIATSKTSNVVPANPIFSQLGDYRSLPSSLPTSSTHYSELLLQQFFSIFKIRTITFMTVIIIYLVILFCL